MRRLYHGYFVPANWSIIAGGRMAFVLLVAFLAVLASGAGATNTVAAAVQGDASQRSTPSNPESDEAARLGVDKLFGSTKLRGFGRYPTFTSDGKHVVGTNGKSLKLLNVQTGETVERPMLAAEGDEYGTIGYSTLYVSPDGNRLAAAGSFDHLSVWNLATGECLFAREKDNIGRSFTGLAWSPDGTRLLTGDGDANVALWDAETGEAIARVEQPLGINDEGAAVAWSPDGSRVAAGSGKPYSVSIYDAETLQERLKLETEPNVRIRQIAYLSDVELLTIERGDTIEFNGQWQTRQRLAIWNPTTGELIRELDWWSEVPRPATVMLTPDQAKLLVQHQDFVRLYDLESGDVLFESAPLRYASPLQELAVSVDGSMFAFGGSLLKLHDTDSGARHFSSPADGHDGDVAEAVPSPDSSLLATLGTDAFVRVWDMETSALVGEFDVAKDALPLTACWSADASVLYVMAQRDHTQSRKEDAVVLAFDVRKNAILYQSDVAIQRLLLSRSMAASHDGRMLAVAAWGPRGLGLREPAQLEILDARTGRRIRRFEIPELEGVRGLAFLPDNRHLATNGSVTNAGLRIWDSETGKLVRSMVGNLRAGGAISADGTINAAIGQAGELVMMSTTTGEEVRRISEPGCRVSKPFVLTDGQRVAALCFSTIDVEGRPLPAEVRQFRIWEIASGRRLTTIGGEVAESADVISPDGKYLIDSFFNKCRGLAAAWKVDNKDE